MLSSFYSGADGVKIPMVMPTRTVSMNHQDEIPITITASGRAFIFNSFTANNIPNTAVLSHAALGDVLSSVPQTINITYGAENNVQPKTAFITGLNRQQFIAALKVSKSAPNSLFVTKKVVSAGIRLVRNSRFENESGMVYAHYAIKGAKINESPALLIRDYSNPCSMRVSAFE